MERKLASVQIIDDIRPIENSDFLEEAIVGGWSLVIKKGEFNFRIGDLAIYLEIDSVLDPDNHVWVKKYVPYMEKSKWRVKTVRLRGQISQGLLIPLYILDELSVSVGREVNIDCTEVLGITKYEVPEKFIHGQAKGNFPTHLGINKTDETRLASCMNAIEELNNSPYYITQKVDGTSGTFYIDPQTNEFEVCSRNMRKRRAVEGETECVYWKAANNCGLEEKLRIHPEWCPQAEIAGVGIQGNKLGLKNIQLYAFNIYHMVDKRYLRFDEFVSACQELGIETVPILEAGDSFGYTFTELQNMSDNGRYNSGSYQEGIVVRAQDNRVSKALGNGRLSFKVINRNFLLKYDE